MSATIELEPELIERLTEKAKEQGQSVNDLLRKMIDESEALPSQADEYSMEEFEADLNALADGTEHLPTLPEDFSREDIYCDHD